MHRITALAYGVIAFAELARHLPLTAALALAAAIAVPVALPPMAGFATLWTVAMTCVTISPADAMVALLPLAYPLVRIAATRATPAAAAALAAALAAASATALPDFQHRGGAVAFALFYGLVWTAGYAFGMHRRYTARLLEHSVTQERMRIARELHDVVAHGMSVITVQAGFGGLVIDQRPEEARAALGVIESTGRDLLAESRRLLGILRGPEAPRAPVPGLADLDHLVTRLTEAGVRVELTIDGPPRPIPPGIDLSAYRIVQEALTNVAKHADTNTAQVTVTHRPDALHLEITNPSARLPERITHHGRTPDGHGLSGMCERIAQHGGGFEGHGLIGMRERVELYDGTLEAGAQPGGGFRVAAVIPLADG